MYKQWHFFTILVVFTGVIWFYLREDTNKSGIVETRTYNNLTEIEISFVDRIESGAVVGYDARRFGISILRHVRDHKKVPIHWDDVINSGNKTGLGLYWLYQYPVNQIVLMNQQLHYYDTVEGHIGLVDGIDSIKQEIDDFFKYESKWIDSFKAIELTSRHFNLNSTDLPNELVNDDIEENRYFKEGYLLNETGLAHYEVRFYHSKLPMIDRIAILHRIIRAWARFTTRASIDTWIAHGSLMGYYFNGLIMPWDDDLDVQVTAESFWKLLRHNGSIIIDYQDEVNIGKYLIDVNPWFWKRDGNQDNKIDARFIDVDSGLYIDVTALTTETNPSDIIGLGSKEATELNKVLDPYFDPIHTTQGGLFSDELFSKINETWEEHDLVSCKDYHFYKISELSPLIPTLFEGEIVMIPNNLQNILLREYGRKSLYLTTFKTWSYNKLEKLWVHKTLKYESSPLLLKFISYHSKIKERTFKKHTFDIELLERFPSFRVEPWIRDVTIGKLL